MPSPFTYHTQETAPDAAKPWLPDGFIPNLHAVMAESPQLLEAYRRLWDLLPASSGCAPAPAFTSDGSRLLIPDAAPPNAPPGATGVGADETGRACPSPSPRNVASVGVGSSTATDLSTSGAGSFLLSPTPSRSVGEACPPPSPGLPPSGIARGSPPPDGEGTDAPSRSRPGPAPGPVTAATAGVGVAATLVPSRAGTGPKRKATEPPSTGTAPEEPEPPFAAASPGFAALASRVPASSLAIRSRKLPRSPPPFPRPAPIAATGG